VISRRPLHSRPAASIGALQSSGRTNIRDGSEGSSPRFLMRFLCTDITSPGRGSTPGFLRGFRPSRRTGIRFVLLDNGLGLRGTQSAWLDWPLDWVGAIRRPSHTREGHPKSGTARRHSTNEIVRNRTQADPFPGYTSVRSQVRVLSRPPIVGRESRQSVAP
jgi:hypothetical protein